MEHGIDHDETSQTHAWTNQPSVLDSFTETATQLFFSRTRMQKNRAIFSDLSNEDRLFSHACIESGIHADCRYPYLHPLMDECS
ncbi:hypothetical protein [Burkholderia sp. A1]|uniref:hypothetical protein n=1 Tax=Burkholderia sp. A1 TaxID=148446 RepID=UPI0012692DE0|nr:hypothetical protein [Burkholderia sp. A1]